MSNGAEKMVNKIGYAILKGKCLYFDDLGWDMVRAIAKRAKKSPKYIVIGALKRYAKRYGNEKSKDA
jgi:hypothetical protein